MKLVATDKTNIWILQLGFLICGLNISTDTICEFLLLFADFHLDMQISEK